MKIAKNFILQEWVPKIIYDIYGAQSIRFVDMETVAVAQKIRDRWGRSMLINDWHKSKDGYDFNFRGFRPPECGWIKWMERRITKAQMKELLDKMPQDQREYLEALNFGSWLSQHKFARAFDYNIQGVPAHEVYQDILNNQAWYLEAGITTIESIKMATTWSHNDRRHTGKSEILIVEP